MVNLGERRLLSAAKGVEQRAVIEKNVGTMSQAAKPQVNATDKQSHTAFFYAQLKNAAHAQPVLAAAGGK